jgi:hypothetical protein
MKTPMQEMIDEMNKILREEKECFILDLRDKARELLKKEKEVIVNAVKQGWDYNEEGLVQWMGETYYNETFNTK